MVRISALRSVGQGGIQLGNNVWELYCAEHGIELVPLSTRGDEILDRSLQRIGGKQRLPKRS